MRDVANVVVVGALCAVGAEHGWPNAWGLWLLLGLVLMLAELRAIGREVRAERQGLAREGRGNAE